MRQALTSTRSIDVAGTSLGILATVDVPGQRGGNITMCAAISEQGVVHKVPAIGPFNTDRLLLFLDGLFKALITEVERGVVAPDLPNLVVVWDNVRFHYSNQVRAWFDVHPRMFM